MTAAVGEKSTDRPTSDMAVLCSTYADDALAAILLRLMRLEVMAKEVKNALILRSSGIVNANGFDNSASVFSKRGEKGVNQDCLVMWEHCKINSFCSGIAALTIIRQSKFGGGVQPAGKPKGSGCGTVGRGRGRGTGRGRGRGTGRGRGGGIESGSASGASVSVATGKRKAVDQPQ
ncbi:hypothetical protein RHMOL_Rhmol02G0268700 [Rhododendron molle]|uniref:Uncharacterized protein n=1 Tax=Rhododendron molle TaxID=49168 RepID=A0ACC0PXB0_RHOML|nr:hypothetical protein RHMOL_Rhmol02G0268700 [Rhododendron molle]